MNGKKRLRKNMDSNITIITNFFDIGRGNLPTQIRGLTLPHFQHRSTDVYFSYFEKLAKIKNPMVIYTSEEFAERIRDIRKENGLEEKTSIVILDSFLPKEFEKLKDEVKTVLDSPDFYSKVDKPHFVEYWWPEYIMIQLMKVFYINNAIDSGLVKTDLTAWIDFGYCRNDTTLPLSNEWSYDFDKDKIHLFSLRPIEPQRPIDDIIYRGDVYVMGCHMVAGTHMWKDYQHLVYNNMLALLKHNLVHYDQTLYLMSYLTKPEIFSMHYVDPADWFIIFNQYNNSK
jgi:protein YibB